MKKILLSLMILFSLTALIACGKDTTTSMTQRLNPLITIEIEGKDPMVLELYYDIAPNTVRNFVALAEKHYFDGVIFHRVIKNFMIQGGQGATNSCRISGEFASNGFENDLKHVRGVISMARTSEPNSATSQFFIMHKDSPHLDGQYAGFGMLLSGFETLDYIASVRTNYADKPVADVVIKTLRVDTRGVTYDAPTCR